VFTHLLCWVAPPALLGLPTCLVVLLHLLCCVYSPALCPVLKKLDMFWVKN
jgi:hypothetical protein